MEFADITDLLNQESFKDLFDNAHDLIHIVDLDGKILFANKSWQNILEYPLEEIQGKFVYSFIEEENRAFFINYRNQIIKECCSDDKEIIVRFITKSGKKVSLEGCISLRKEGEKPFYTRGFFRDITSKLESEAHLIEREHNLQQLLLNAPDAIIVINQESLITFWNPQAEKMFGWKTADVFNQPLSTKIIPKQHREAHDKGMKRYLATGVAYVLNKTIEITAVNIHGEEFYVSLTISTTTQNGKLAFIAFIRDIGEQKKNEAELRHKKMELESSNRQLEQFAHVASHDLKEPIRKIKVFSDLLECELENTLTQKAKTYLSKINTATERLQNMVEGVLNYATISNINEAFVPVDLNQIVKSIESDLELVIAQKKALIKYSNLPTLHGVSFLIYQLFYNLILNSLKFSNQNVPPLIEITADEVNSIEMKPPEVADSNTLFLVKLKDNGIGFDQEQNKRIFEPFTRLNNSSVYEGTGLGLSLCKNIMERHNGFIKAEGEKEIGATFNMYFHTNEYNAKLFPD